VLLLSKTIGLPPTPDGELRAARGGYEPAELNRIGCRLYERFRPEILPGNTGRGAKAALEVDKILSAARAQWLRQGVSPAR
jgi:hypothetical protein